MLQRATTCQFPNANPNINPQPNPITIESSSPETWVSFQRVKTASDSSKLDRPQISPNCTTDLWVWFLTSHRSVAPHSTRASQRKVFKSKCASCFCLCKQYYVGPPFRGPAHCGPASCTNIDRKIITTRLFLPGWSPARFFQFSVFFSCL